MLIITTLSAENFNFEAETFFTLCFCINSLSLVNIIQLVKKQCASYYTVCLQFWLLLLCVEIQGFQKFIKTQSSQSLFLIHGIWKSTLCFHLWNKFLWINMFVTKISYEQTKQETQRKEVLNFPGSSFLASILTPWNFAFILGNFALSVLVSIVLQIPQVNSAALVVAYENGDPAHIHFLDAAKCQYYWKKWLDKLHQYWLLKSSGAASWRNCIKKNDCIDFACVWWLYYRRGKIKLHHVS